MKTGLFLDEVRRFESCEYGLQEFGHTEHLKVAWTYLQLYGYEAALVRMREGLLRFSAHHNRNGYNETITVFWMRNLEAHCRGNPVEVLLRADKQLLFRHFSRERVMSEEAKRKWIEPDLMPFVSSDALHSAGRLATPLRMSVAYFIYNSRFGLRLRNVPE